MKSRSKREKIIKIRKIIITILIVILSSTLINSYMGYKKTSKKIEVKKSIRELILVLESARVNDDIEFSDIETISDIKVNGGEKLEAINKYSNINDFNNIEALTIEDAKKIINDEEDFEVNNKGQFVKLK